VDPDIDTLPLLAWSTEMASTVSSAAHRGLLQFQQYFFFPILLFARFSWCEQSVSHNFVPKANKVRLCKLLEAGHCIYDCCALRPASAAVSGLAIISQSHDCLQAVTRCHRVRAGTHWSILKSAQATARGWEELIMLGLHYAWYLGMVFSFLPFWKGLLFVVLSQVCSGYVEYTDHTTD